LAAVIQISRFQLLINAETGLVPIR
jgi:hypothetical protein